MHQPSDNKGQILYADDNPFAREHFINLLKESYPDCQVNTFENGLQLINHLLSIKDPEQLPKKIVLDLFMPSWNGFQTLKALKEDELYQKIPVSMVTASSDEEDIQMIKKFGATHCVSKPLTTNTISFLVEDSL